MLRSVLNQFVVVLGTFAAILFTSIAAAQTLYFGSFGGSIHRIFEETVIPAFEKKTGAKVVYVPGNSADTLAKLTAQKGKPDISIAMMDDGMMFTAVQRGLCAPLRDTGSVKDVYPLAKVFDGKAVGISLYAIGLGYNTQVFAEKGWAAPTSWHDLGNPLYKGRVSMGSIASYGMWGLVAMARVNGGGEENIEPGFRAMTEKIAPNILAWESSQANLARMLQTGEAALVLWGDSRVQNLIAQGAPVAFVYPKEGAISGMTAACVVEGAPQAELAQRFLEEMLSPDVQALLAQSAGLGPINSKVVLDPAVAKTVVYGAERVASLWSLKWDTINQGRAEWTRRWNREVEQ